MAVRYTVRIILRFWTQSNEPQQPAGHRARQRFNRRALRPLARGAYVLIALAILSLLANIVGLALGDAYFDLTWLLAMGVALLLLHGSLGTARGVAFASAMSFVFSLITLIGVLVVTPVDLLRVLLATAPTPVVIAVGFQQLLGLLLPLWLYLQMRSPAVLAERATLGRSTSKPWIGFALGALGGLALCAWLHAMPRSEGAQTAALIAEKQLAPGYTLYVPLVIGDAQNGAALVTAYTDSSVRALPVIW